MCTYRYICNNNNNTMCTRISPLLNIRTTSKTNSDTGEVSYNEDYSKLHVHISSTSSEHTPPDKIYM